ncbi:hypothetical protein LUZ60_016288 [Juncus effusus]|nr:hypothetical protein LUZ60_016288 [Juncus effusus]
MLTKGFRQGFDSMWRCVPCSGGKRPGLRRLSSVLRRHAEDEGDWAYSPEWWDPPSAVHTVFSEASEHGNGLVSVVSYPASRPGIEQWSVAERWFQEKYAKMHPKSNHGENQFRVLGYQWRVLRFNEETRQSTVKVMAACKISEPKSLILMQQPHCLAVPYVKSMVSVGLTALASSSFDFVQAVLGKTNLNILCIGHGAGTIPLFLATKIKGAKVHVVEIDPVVIKASVEAMGFPSLDSGHEFQWDETLKNSIFIHKSDAHDFIKNDMNKYDLVFVDAYDGDDIFPNKLWDKNGSFLSDLAERVDPLHGTVVVNLHSDLDLPSNGLSNDFSFFPDILARGKYVNQVCTNYKSHFGGAFTVQVPWLCNITLVASRAKSLESENRDLVLSRLASKTNLVDSVLDLKFSCLEYVKKGFMLVG